MSEAELSLCDHSKVLPPSQRKNGTKTVAVSAADAKSLSSSHQNAAPHAKPPHASSVCDVEGADAVPR